MKSGNQTWLFLLRSADPLASDLTDLGESLLGTDKKLEHKSSLSDDDIFKESLQTFLYFNDTLHFDKCCLHICHHNGDVKTSLRGDRCDAQLRKIIFKALLKHFINYNTLPFLARHDPAKRSEELSWFLPVHMTAANQLSVGFKRKERWERDRETQRREKERERET